MFKTRFISMLVLLMTAVTGAWAQGYNVTFWLGGGWNPTVNVTSFPQTFTKIGGTSLYPWTVMGTSYAEEFVSVSVTNDGNGMVSASKIDGTDMSITVSGPFEGTATIHVEVTMEEGGNASTDITVTCVENIRVTLPSSSASLTVGEKVALTATVLPDNATDKKVKWVVASGSDKVKLYTDEACQNEVGSAATAALTVYAKGLSAGEATVKVASNADATKYATCTVTVAPATYSVALKEGTDDATSWQGKAGEGNYQALPLAGVEAGKAVSVKYSGTMKVKSVRAKKKAAAGIVNPVVGQVIGSDGKNYDATATLPSGVAAVAKICYVGSDNGEAAPYNHGLALALSDASTGCKWSTTTGSIEHTYNATNDYFASESGLQYNDTHNSDTYPAFKAAIANNGTAAPTGCSSWFLASGYQWEKMNSADGLSNFGFGEYTKFWSSTERNASYVWAYSPFQGWSYFYKYNTNRVRACLAF